MFQTYFVNTIKNRYAQFDGRASRSEFWYFQLFYMIIVIAISVLTPLLANVSTSMALIPTGILLILSLGLLVPSLALSIRRLHDSDKSGWLLLCGLIPIVGSIIIIVFMCLDSTPGTNQYGPHPYDDQAISDSGNFSEVIDR